MHVLKGLPVCTCAARTAPRSLSWIWGKPHLHGLHGLTALACWASRSGCICMKCSFPCIVSYIQSNPHQQRPMVLRADSPVLHASRAPPMQCKLHVKQLPPAGARCSPWLQPSCIHVHASAPITPGPPASCISGEPHTCRGCVRPMAAACCAAAAPLRRCVRRMRCVPGDRAGPRECPSSISRSIFCCLICRAGSFSTAPPP